MDILEIMRQRHSVRRYSERIIEEEKRAVLDTLAQKINKESGMHIQIIYDEPKCFRSMRAHYGKFSGCCNYISIIGVKEKNLQEKAGYYGQQIVLKAQELGLNTCWCAMTHGKSTAVISKGEKEVILIALGYGLNQGYPHKNKALQEVSSLTDHDLEWYQRGMEAVMLAPTAMNQQKFYFTFSNNRVIAKARGGFYSRIDLGIVKYHFEAASGHRVG